MVERETGETKKKESRGKTEPRATPNIFRRCLDGSASLFNSQLSRAKNQNWWSFAKMVVVFSVGLLFFSGLALCVMIVWSFVTNMDMRILLPIAAIALQFGQIIFFVFGAILLGAIAGGISIIHGGTPVIGVKNIYLRYIIHIGKIVTASTLIIGYYAFFFKDMYSSPIEFIIIITAITGLLLLPVGLILWGAVGIQIERKREE